MKTEKSKHENACRHRPALWNRQPLLVCTPCAKVRRIEEKDLIEGARIEGARMATATELINLSCDAAVISL